MSYSPSELDAYDGEDWQVPGNERCRGCNGTGFAVAWHLCLDCHGSGSVKASEVNDERVSDLPQPGLGLSE